MTIYEVLDKIQDSRNFTVGGGAASALAGSMAAGLIGMVVRLSTGKDYGYADEEYEVFAKELDVLCEELNQGARDDCDAFLGIKAAFSLPKQSDDEKAKRKAAVDKAAIEAANVPLRNAEKSLRTLEIGRKLEGKTNPAAGSDIMIGQMLARVAAIGCALNIDANLPLIKTVSERERLEEASKNIQKAAQ